MQKSSGLLILSLKKKKLICDSDSLMFGLFPDNENSTY